MLQASLFWREGKPREADAALAALAAGGGGGASEAALMRAQLAAARSDPQQALQHLSVRRRCGCCCVLAAWCQAEASLGGLRAREAAVAMPGDGCKCRHTCQRRGCQLHPPSASPCFSLQSISDAAWQARPAVLATKLALLEGQGQAEEAAGMLSAALQQWQSGERRCGALCAHPRPGWHPPPAWAPLACSCTPAPALEKSFAVR